jgi:hypothetical protein
MIAHLAIGLAKVRFLTFLAVTTNALVNLVEEDLVRGAVEVDLPAISTMPDRMPAVIDLLVAR